MHQIIKFFLFILSLLLLFTGCLEDYKKGPLISMYNSSSQLTGKWHMESFIIDGRDSTKLYKDSCNCDLNFDLYYERSDEVTVFNPINCNYTPFDSMFSNWDIDGNSLILYNHKKNKMLPLDKPYSNWNIIKLTEQQAWFKTTYNKKSYYLLLKK